MDTPYNIQDRSFLFACRIVAFSKPLFAAHPAYRELARQLIKAGTSVGANLEEADAGQSTRDFRSKIAIARKESREARYWLRLIAHAEPHLQPAAGPLIDEARQIYSILTAIKRNSESRRSQ